MFLRENRTLYKTAPLYYQILTAETLFINKIEHIALTKIEVIWLPQITHIYLKLDFGFIAHFSVVLQTVFRPLSFAGNNQTYVYHSRV